MGRAITLRIILCVVVPLLAVSTADAVDTQDLEVLKEEVIDAARSVLHADRGTVYVYAPDTDELSVTVGTDLEPVRFPADQGIAGECAQTRKVINVPDCYRDPRFNPAFDRESGYHTRCMLTLPLIDMDETLIGVLQISEARCVMSS